MRSDPRHDAPDVRAFLERMAAETRIPSEDPGPVLRRARRRAAATIVGGMLAVAIVATGGMAALEAIRTSEHPTPLESEPPPTGTPTVPVTGRFGETDLRDLVLRASERPAGYGLRQDPSYSQSDSVTSVATTLDIPVSELAQAGFVTAHFNGFLSDGFLDPHAPPEERIDLVSYAILFPDAQAADAGYELFSAGPTTSEVANWRSDPIEGLGEEARASRGLVADVPTTAIVWRVDNVVLFIASQGFGGAIPLEELEPLAQRMDARAT